MLGEKSIGGHLKKLEETYGILRRSESFFHKFNLHIIQCDAKIQQDQKITSQQELAQYMASFDLRGSGGTDFRPVFEHVAALTRQGAVSASCPGRGP